MGKNLKLDIIHKLYLYKRRVFSIERERKGERMFLSKKYILREIDMWQERNSHQTEELASIPELASLKLNSAMPLPKEELESILKLGSS